MGIKNNNVLSRDQITALNIIKQYGYEKFISKLGENGGYITKEKVNILSPSKKTYFVPVYVSPEFAMQVINRKKLYDFYSQLRQYENSVVDLKQQQLASDYAHIIKKVQNICLQLKDDEAVYEFISYLTKKFESDISLEIVVNKPSIFSHVPPDYRWNVKLITPPLKKDLRYMSAQLKHIQTLLEQNNQSTLL